jgi:hypothetical protein
MEDRRRGKTHDQTTKYDMTKTKRDGKQEPRPTRLARPIPRPRPRPSKNHGLGGLVLLVGLGGYG